jgi:hypothetical protein
MVSCSGILTAYVVPGILGFSAAFNTFLVLLVQCKMAVILRLKHGGAQVFQI